MYKVAILGCENSHADTFMKYITESEKFKDLEVVGVYSDEQAACDRLHDKFGLYVAESYREFAGKVDGVIITARHGGNHYKYAKPYIKSGIPMFIDKPITVSETEAVLLARELKENRVRVTGGSCCVYAAGVCEIKQRIAGGEWGRLYGGALRAPINMKNNYGGFFFYSQHLTEVMCSVFGYYPKSVKMYQNGGCYKGIVRYEDYDVFVEYVDGNNNYFLSASCEAGVIGENYGLDGCFQKEFDEFYRILCGGAQKHSYKDFIAPVFILNAMYRSLQNGTEENINEIEEI